MIEHKSRRRHSFAAYGSTGAIHGVRRCKYLPRMGVAAAKPKAKPKEAPSLKAKARLTATGPVGLSSATVSFTTDPTSAYYVLPKYVVGLKCYTPFQTQWWPDQTTKTADGLTYRQMFADMKVDMLCATDVDHPYVPAGLPQSAWAAVRDMNFWLADLTGCGASCHFVINHNAAGNSGFVGTFQSVDSSGNAPASTAIDATDPNNPFSPIGMYQGGQNEHPVGISTPTGLNNLLQYINHFGGDLSRIPTVEVCNEPPTMNAAQLGQTHAWYRTDSDACDRFLDNQIRRYSAAFESLYPGLGAKVGGPSTSIGADPVKHVSDRNGGINDAPTIINRYINGYNDYGGGWRWGPVTGSSGTGGGSGTSSSFVSTDPNTAHVKIFTTHGYNTSSTSLATAGGGPIQDVLNSFFYEFQTQNGTRTSGSPTITGLSSTSGWTIGMAVTGTGIPAGAKIASVNSGTSITLSASATSSGTSAMQIYDGEALFTIAGNPSNFNAPKGGYICAWKKWRKMIDAAPNSSDVVMAGTEMWPWASNEHDGQEAITDLGMFIAAMEMAGTVKLHAYFFAGGFVASSAAANGTPIPGDNNAPSDAHFSVVNGQFKRVTRVFSIRDFASRVNHNGPKNLCPMTITDSVGPSGTGGNGIRSLRGFNAITTDGQYQECVLMNTNTLDAKSVTLNWDRTLASITNAKAMDVTTPFDTQPSSPTISFSNSGSTASAVVTIPPGGVIGFRAQFGTTVTPTVPQNLTGVVVSGVAQVGSVLTDQNADTWTGSPSSYIRQWQRDNNGGGVWSNISGAAGTSYTQVTADLNCQVRLAKQAHNGAGDSLVVYSNTSGLVAAAGTTTTFGRTLIGAHAGSFGRPYLVGAISTAGSTGSISSIWAYVGGNASGTSVLRAAVWNASGVTPNRAPGALIAAGSEVVIQQGQAPGWVQFPINAPVTNGQNYTLSLWSGGATNPDFYYDDGTLADDGHYVQMNPYDPTANPTSPWPTNNLEQRLWSIYAVVAPPAATPPHNLTPPAITGNALEGSVLTVSDGTWSDGSISYLWFRETGVGTGVFTSTGVTSNTYTVLAGDHGLMLRAAVTATGTGGPTTQTATAVGPAVAKPTSATAPSIAGSTIDGQILSAINDAWNHTPLTGKTYQWYRVDADGTSNLTALSGQTNPTLSIGTALVGKRTIVKMTATNSAGTSSVVSSAASAVITAVTALGFDTLTETFEDALNPANWITRHDGTSTVAPIGGRTVFTLGSLVGDITEIARTDFRSLRGTSFHVQLPDNGNQTDGAVYQWVQLYLDDNNVMGFFVNGGTVRPWASVNGVFGWLASAIPFAGGWAKFSELSGTMTIQVAADHDTLLTAPTTLWSGSNPLPVTQLKLQLGGQSDGTGSGIVSFDSLNTIPGPENIVPPSLSSRQPRVGVAVICNPGVWKNMDAPDAYFTYQWKEAVTRDGPYTIIQGATNSRYIPSRKDANLWLECEVTPHNASTD